MSSGDKKLGRRKSFELKNQKDSRDSKVAPNATFGGDFRVIYV